MSLLLGDHIHWQNPEALWLLFALPILLLWVLWMDRRRRSTIKFPALAMARKARTGWKIHLRHLPLALRLFALGMFIVALARPQSTLSLERTTTEGVDIMLVLDVSGSMDMMDMLTRTEQAKLGMMDAERMYRTGGYKEFTRLGYSRKVISEFVEKRQSDRLGLTVFATTAFTQCPLTLDYGVLLELLAGVNDSTLDNRGTAIGDGLMNALIRLKDSKAKSRVVVLLTDGANNAGELHPLRAADVARAMGVKVYTIGVGRTQGTTLAFRQNFFGSIEWHEMPMPEEGGVDAPTLRKMAESTGGQFFMARDKDELAKIYETIDGLERTEIQSWSFTRYSEHFHPWLLIGAALLMLELLLANTRFTRIP